MVRFLSPDFQQGEKNSQAKITESDVLDIFRWRIEGVPVSEIANRVDLSGGSVRNILSRERWSHVPIATEVVDIVRGMLPNRVHLCARGESDRREYGHSVNRLDHCSACAEDDRVMRDVIDRGDVCPAEPRTGLWHRLGSFPGDRDVCITPRGWLRYLRVGTLPPLVAALLILFPSMVGSQGVVETVLLRWEDPSVDPGASGFVVHLEQGGSVVDTVYMVGDGSMTEMDRVYSVFLEVGPGETHVSVSAFAPEGTFVLPWSEGSEVRTYNATTLCDRADFTGDGIVGGPDFGVFRSVFGLSCDSGW